MAESPRRGSSPRIDTGHLAEEKRRIARDIVLERAQIRPLQERVVELTKLVRAKQYPEGPSKTVEDDERKYRLACLEKANKEKASLDAELAKLKPIYCNEYSDELEREIEYARHLMRENKDDMKIIEDTIEDRRRQLEEILTSAEYLEVEHQRNRIDEMNRELQKLIAQENEAMKGPQCVMNDDLDELRQKVLGLQQKLQELSTVKNRKQDQIRRRQLEQKSRKIVMNKIAKMNLQKQETGTPHYESPIDTAVDWNRKLTKDGIVAQSMRPPDMLEWEKAPRKLRKINSESGIEHSDPRCSRRTTRPIEDEGMKSYFEMELAMKKNREELEKVHGQGEPELELSQASGIVSSSPEFQLADEVTHAKRVSRRRLCESSLTHLPVVPIAADEVPC